MIIRRNLTSLTRVVYGTANKSSGSASNNKAKSSYNKTSSSSTTMSQKNEEPEIPFRNDQYNCPEYFQHDRFSFFELIDRMAEKRLPQKSNKETY